MKQPRQNLVRGLFAAVVATLVIFSGLAPAGAGTTIMHAPKPILWAVDGDPIQAEGWYRATGIQNESTSDSGGGENVGYINDGEWTEYTIRVGHTPGMSDTYLVEARVASSTGGGTITMTVDGTEVGSLDVGNTGGWQSWTTVSTTVQVDHASEVLRLTYTGDDGFLLNINWLDFELVGTTAPPQPSTPLPGSDNPVPINDAHQRQLALLQMVAALESYGSENGTFMVAGGGAGGRGTGWALYEEAGSNYPVATATVLIAEGHMAAGHLRDPLWVDPLSIVGDVLVYPCKDRVAVFTREGDGKATNADSRWWTDNDCHRYPIDRLNATHYVVSSPLAGG